MTVASTFGYLAAKSGSSGTATVTGAGSEWNNSDDLFVGDFGDGTLNVESGGVVSNVVGYLGRRFGNTGEATVTGTGSQWTISDDFRVGWYGNGTLNVEAGGLVSNTDGFIGHQPGSTGNATVTEAGSRWETASSLTVGGNESEAGGIGTLNLTDSGLAVVTDTTRLWSTGTLTLDGGSLTTGLFDNSNAGTLNFHDGTLTVNGGSFDPGVADFLL